MKIIGVRSDESLDIEVELEDGQLAATFALAKGVAVITRQVVHIKFNDQPIAIGPKTNLALIAQMYYFGTPSDQEIGPYPAPEDIPEAECGTFEINIPQW